MSGWTKWNGDECPDLKGLRRDLLRRDGEILDNENIQDWWSDWEWKERKPSPSDIVGYRDAAE